MKEKALTITEQFRQEDAHVDNLLSEIKENLLAKVPQNVDVIYRIVGMPPQIEVWKVDKIELTLPQEYRSRFWERPQIGKRAQRKDVEKITAYFSFIQKIRDKFELSYFISCKHERGVTLSSVRYSDLTKEDGEYTCYYDKAEAECQRRMERYETYYKPREGYTACTYCQKQVPNNRVVYKTIIGIGLKRVYDSLHGRWINKKVVTTQRLPFCSGECAYNEQCSREG